MRGIGGVGGGGGEGGWLIYGGTYTRGNNKISNFNLAISTFLVM